MEPIRPKISVVLPVFQGVRYVRFAVESVLTQSMPAFELIVGDDGSIDGSRGYLESLRDPRVRFFPSRNRKGLFPHLNRLLARCKAPLIRVLCQDDILETDCLKKELQFFQDHPEIGFSISKYRTISSDGGVIAEPGLGDLPAVLPSSLAVQHFFYHGCIAGNLSTVCLRRDLLPDGGFDTSFRVSGDYDLWARMVTSLPMGVLHEPLVRVRSHAEQLSRLKTSSVQFVVENARVRGILFPHLPEKAQPMARRFERRRHGVLDFHMAVRCFLAGRWRDGVLILNTLGKKGTVQALVAWVYTVNNRLVRPQAPWVLPN